MNSKEKSKKKLADLKDMRESIDYEPRTYEERVKMLNMCIDGAINWLTEATMMRASKGTGGASVVLATAIKTMQDLHTLEKIANPAALQPPRKTMFANEMPEFVA